MSFMLREMPGFLLSSIPTIGWSPLLCGYATNLLLLRGAPQSSEAFSPAAPSSATCWT